MVDTTTAADRLVVSYGLADSKDQSAAMPASLPRVPTDPNTELLDALKRQTPGAFPALIQRYQRRLISTSMKITGNREDAEDVVQNTFLQVYRHIDAFRGECQFISWITSIAINQSLMVLRRRKNLNVSIDHGTDGGSEGAFRNIQDPCLTPEERYLKKELSERLIAALGKLRLPNRGVAELHYLGHLSTEEIAHAIGISISATKSRLLRARKELRRDGAKHLSLRSNKTLRTKC